MTGESTGTVYFAPGQTTATITYVIRGDNVAEPTESFVVRLKPTPNANLAQSDGVVRITNDD
jgi:hypothetical protein